MRIKLLDSFRGLSFLFVMLFHYTYSWDNPEYKHPFSMYPYTDWYGSAFKYGYMGVMSFFIISGFVISITLENTKDSISFYKNRFIRLFPSLFLCTIITFTAIHFLDPGYMMPQWHQVKNFLPSLTLISPQIWGKIFNSKFDWLNSSYWSLWAEIQFYILSAILFFSSPKKYFQNSLVLSLVLVVLNKGLKILYHNPNFLHLNLSEATQDSILYLLDGTLEITNYISYFAIGIVCYKLYKDGKITNTTDKILTALVFASSFLYSKSITYYIIQLVIYALFWVMIFRPKWISFLENPVLLRIGALSYTGYLIHEPIGIFVLHNYAGYLGAASVIVPWILIILSVCFAEISFRTYEKYSYGFLKKVLFGPKKTTDKPQLKEA